MIYPAVTTPKTLQINTITFINKCKHFKICYNFIFQLKGNTFLYDLIFFQISVLIYVYDYGSFYLSQLTIHSITKIYLRNLSAFPSKLFTKQNGSMSKIAMQGSVIWRCKNQIVQNPFPKQKLRAKNLDNMLTMFSYKSKTIYFILYQ